MTEESPPGYHTIDAKGMDFPTAYRLLVGAVVPRPIAWVTTVDGTGRVNAAPFSSYNYVATSPPMLAVQISLRAGTDGAEKDTARNIRETGEFVVNVATEANMENIRLSAQNYPPEVSEVEDIGLDLLPSRFVRPPRLAATPIQMECRFDQAVTLGRGINTLYIGEVVAFHLSDRVFDGHRVDVRALAPISRLGGPLFGGLGQVWNRPMLQYAPGGEGSVDSKGDG